MNCTIWRRTSTSAPFSASSANAIVALVIVISFKDRFGGSHLKPYPDLTMATPKRAAAARKAASGYALRALPRSE